MKKKLVWVVAAAVVAAGVYLVLRPKAMQVELGSPQRQAVREYIAEEAKTRLANEYVVAMPVPGTLQRLELEVGEVVQAGQVVARVDAFALQQEIRGVEARVAQARAQIAGVESSKPRSEDIASAEIRAREAADALAISEREAEIAQIDLDNAHKEFERMQRLLAQGVVSQSQFDAAERTYRAAEQNRSRGQLGISAAAKARLVAELGSRRVAASPDDNEYLRGVYESEIQALEAQLELLRSDLQKTEVLSPVNGPVLEKLVQDSRVLQPGTPILRIGDLASIEIETDILSEEIVGVAVGDTAEISGKAVGDNTVPGKVHRIHPAAFMKISSLGIEQQRVKTIVSFDNSTLNLRAGTRLDLRIITDEQPDAIAIPERSTFRRDDAWYVFKVSNGRAQLSPITIGLRNDDWAEITEGVTLQDVIVLEPKNELEDGMRVVPQS
jgi:HlyD family secretion protein